MNTVTIRPWQLTDVASLAEQANNINIWNNVRDYFPHPYTDADAEEFIRMAMEKPAPTVDFAIEVDGKAVGGVGIIPNKDVERISAELGYWLGEEYWGRGIMSHAVEQMCRYVFAELPVIKLYATPFSFNFKSARVLEKAGFVKEGILQKTAVKNGKIIDLHYYGLIKF